TAGAAQQDGHRVRGEGGPGGGGQDRHRAHGVPGQHGAFARCEGRRQHGFQVVGEGVGAARGGGRAAAVAALVVGDDPVVGGQFADLRRPEGGRAGPAVGQDDRGRPVGPVDLDVQPGAVGGDGGQLPDRDGRGV